MPVLNFNDISLRDCDVVKRYNKDIDDSDTLEKLKERLSYWKPLAEDAYQLVDKMAEDQFKDFRKCLAMERKGVYSESEVCANICMPLPMFKVAQVSHKYKVPFGCALHRMIELKVLNEVSHGN